MCEHTAPSRYWVSGRIAWVVDVMVTILVGKRMGYLLSTDVEVEAESRRSVNKDKALFSRNAARSR
jgi:hypothetical protein